MGETQGYNVFSAFNGIGCGFVALERAGIKVNKMYVSEIDDRANTIQRKNWPKTIFYGNIEKIKKEHFLSPIDILMGGSPCQDLSIAGKMAGLSGSRSKLFFDFVRLKKELNPTYFFFENVRMKKESQDKISEFLGCQPIYFDSALVSAQTRKRLYWTNIVSAADFVMPEDRGILLCDILIHEGTGFLHDKIEGESFYRKVDKSTCITATYGHGQDNKHSRVQIKQVNPSKESGGVQPYEQNRVYDSNFKGVAITANKAHTYKVTTHSSQPRNGKGQGGKGHLSKGDGKSYCIDTSCTTMVEYADTYRKLTPIEVERCFSLDDNYTKGISNSARYHGLGNGWEVATITEFFKYLPKTPNHE